MDIRQLRQFVTLAETLNFGRAASLLHMAQPPLSVAIRKLEEELGVALFERTTRGVRLTDAGHAALDDARRALFHAAEAGRAAKATALGESGRVRLGFVGSATYGLMQKLLPPFRRQYPNVKIELKEATNALVLEMLEQREIDMGIVRLPLARPPRVEILALEEDRFIAGIPADNPLARKNALSLRDLADEEFVLYTAGKVPGLQALTMAVFQQAGFIPKSEHHAIQVQSVITLVECGFGVALLPSQCTRAHVSDSIIFRELSDLPPAGRIGMGLAYLPEHESPAARRFRELAAAVST